MEGFFQVLPLTVLVGAAAILFNRQWVSRQRSEQRFDRARKLYDGLVSGSVRDARHTLGRFHWQKISIECGGERDDVMSAFYCMLWVFSQVWVGRLSLMATNFEKRDASVKYLDRSIQPHVLEFICTFAVVKEKLKNADGGDRVFEGLYADDFNSLRNALAQIEGDDTVKKTLLKGHVHNHEKCLCMCHE